MITEIAFTSYGASDMARSRHFYEEVLGLKVSHNVDNRWIEYDIGAGTFAIHAIIPAVPSGPSGEIGFEVDDFGKTIESLKAAGVPFLLETTETPVCHLAIINDPDQNRVIIHKRK